VKVELSELLLNVSKHLFKASFAASQDLPNAIFEEI